MLPKNLYAFDTQLNGEINHQFFNNNYPNYTIDKNLNFNTNLYSPETDNLLNNQFYFQNNNFQSEISERDHLKQALINKGKKNFFDNFNPLNLKSNTVNPLEQKSNLNEIHPLYLNLNSYQSYINNNSFPLINNNNNIAACDINSSINLSPLPSNFNLNNNFLIDPIKNIIFNKFNQNQQDILDNFIHIPIKIYIK